jgi:YfiH family protein
MRRADRRVFQLIARGGVKWLECNPLSSIPWLRHAFSTRVLRPTSSLVTKLSFGSNTAFVGLNVGLAEGDGRTQIEPNRRLFFNRLGVGTLALAGLRQIHSAAVYRVSVETSGPRPRPNAVRRYRAASRGWSKGHGNLVYIPSGCTPAQAASEGTPYGDALVTDQPGVLLPVCTADCVPLLLVDPARRAIAAVHAGWRGSLERVAEKTVGEMRRTFHSQPEELLAAIGPCIGACCYEVGEEVVEAFRGRFTRCEGYFTKPRLKHSARAPRSRYPRLFLSSRTPGHGPDAGGADHLDLVAVTRDQLRNAGLRTRNIHVARFCTACRTDLFYSHRKEGPTGRMMAVIGMV